MTRVHIVAIAALAAALGAFVVLFGHGSKSSSDGSGHPVTQTRTVSAFEAVDLAGSNRVVVHVGGNQSVVVHADDNLVAKVTTTVAGGTLRVDTRGSFTTKTPMLVEVTVPAVRALTLSGSGSVTAEGIDARTLKVVLSGSGLLVATGHVGVLDASLPGSGNAELSQLVARDATAVMGGSGRLAVNATNTLRATVSGTGMIQYLGNPAHVTRNVSGTGAIVAG